MNHLLYNYVVRWTPPYSNTPKDQPVEFRIEAERLVDWFRSIGVMAFIVRIGSVESRDEY